MSGRSQESDNEDGWYADCARIFQELSREGDKSKERRTRMSQGLKSLLEDVTAIPIDTPKGAIPRKKFRYEKRL